MVHVSTIYTVNSVDYKSVGRQNNTHAVEDIITNKQTDNSI